VRADAGADYLQATSRSTWRSIEPTVATPGDPRNGIPIGGRRSPARSTKADAQGKVRDRHRLRRIVHRRQEGRHGHVRRGRAQGGRSRAILRRRRRLYIQFGSQKIRDYARRWATSRCSRQAGVELIDPSCGACIKAGPGVSDRPDQVTVSAINRNFPGRSGPGQVYLASPLVVAASAFFGRIVAPEEVLDSCPAAF
jgi:3-isopropylmalate/(R)-2-methylmalate dehydratase large subunit